MSRRQPGDMTTLEQNFLACCLSLVGLSTATLIALRLTARRIDRALTMPVPRRSRGRR